MHYRCIYRCIFSDNFIRVNFAFRDNNYVVETIDVDQGDSIFVSFPHNKGNILIDTGGKISYGKRHWYRRGI